MHDEHCAMKDVYANNRVAKIDISYLILNSQKAWNFKY